MQLQERPGQADGLIEKQQGLVESEWESPKLTQVFSESHEKEDSHVGIWVLPGRLQQLIGALAACLCFSYAIISFALFV